VGQQELRLNYGDGRVGPWDCVSWDRELYRSLILNSEVVGWQRSYKKYGDGRVGHGIVYHG